ncbi:MAG: cytochrome c [Methylibium sp.]|uniref:c-type cytochrome n=1 Tax=Methylibium sp. TaxID=2067992 RepID=UPI0017EC69C7|nr:cytochrome c [Methylibium sp.]MBA3595919.1 cytochrome c [Methylibium sp.]
MQANPTRRIACAFVLSLCGLATMLADAGGPGSSSGPSVGAVSRHGGGVPDIDEDDGDRINGRRLFLSNNCYICHGGRGGGGMCPSLREDRPHGDDAVRAILNGTRNGMPPFRDRLSAQDIADLLAYIDSLRRDEEPTFTHWWEPVPTR